MVFQVVGLGPTQALAFVPGGGRVDLLIRFVFDANPSLEAAAHLADRPLAEPRSSCSASKSPEMPTLSNGLAGQLPRAESEYRGRGKGPEGNQARSWTQDGRASRREVSSISVDGLEQPLAARQGCA